MLSISSALGEGVFLFYIRRCFLPLSDSAVDTVEANANAEAPLLHCPPTTRGRRYLNSKCRKPL